MSTDSRREEIFTEPAFFIEEDWEVAARHGMEVIEQQQLSIEQLDEDHVALLSVFQFMIGNTDWSAIRAAEGEPCCHNGNVIGSDQIKIVLPYDFDQAGLISTDYARPNSSLGIRTVRQRLYRGFCATNEATERAIDRIIAVRSSLEDVIISSEASESTRERALEYLHESLDILATPASRSDRILEKCR